MRILPAEFAERRKALAAKLEERGLAGCVLFETHYVTYYTGFSFIPTERPIAFVLVRDGRGGMLVPRLEVEHARENAAVTEVAHYDEYPGERHPMEALVELLGTLGIGGPIGADHDGYPWVFGYRGPSLGTLTGAAPAPIADLVEDQMAVKSEAELALLRESCKWGNLAHTLRDGRMRGEERREPFLEKRVERPERLGRRRRFELDELGGLLEAQQRVGKPVRRAAQLGCATVRLELALRRDQHVHARRCDRPEHEEQRTREEAADAAQLDRRGSQHDDGRL
jgi:hypothetical protein